MPASSAGMTELKSSVASLRRLPLPRLLARLGQAGSGRDEFPVDLELDQRRLAAGGGTIQRRQEIGRPLHPLAMRAEGAGQCCEVRIEQVRAADPVRVALLLVQADRAVHLRSEEHTSELQSLMRISYAVFF